MSGLHLVIGDKNYSSWSMRAWLLLRWLELPFEETVVPLYRPQSRQTLRRWSGAAKVPVLIDGELTVWDTLAIFEHMADASPVWPTDPERRAFARSVCAEMHSGFGALRSAMPCNTRARGRRVPMTLELAADIERVQDIWAEGLSRFGGPWLTGEAFGAADIFYAPPATRFTTYGVAVRPGVSAYRDRLLAHPLVAEWLEAGRREPGAIPACEVGLSQLA